MALPESPALLNSLETGWLLAKVLPEAARGDRVARGLYVKLKACSIANGVEWYYGDPPWLTPPSST